MNKPNNTPQVDIEYVKNSYHKRQQQSHDLYKSILRQAPHASYLVIKSLVDQKKEADRALRHLADCLTHFIMLTH